MDASFSNSESQEISFTSSSEHPSEFTYHSNINGEETSFTVDLEDLNDVEIEDFIDDIMDAEVQE
jgi:hypothetical protein